MPQFGGSACVCVCVQSFVGVAHVIGLGTIAIHFGAQAT